MLGINSPWFWLQLSVWMEPLIQATLRRYKVVLLFVFIWLVEHWNIRKVHLDIWLSSVAILRNFLSPNLSCIYNLFARAKLESGWRNIFGWSWTFLIELDFPSHHFTLDSDFSNKYLSSGWKKVSCRQVWVCYAWEAV